MAKKIYHEVKLKEMEVHHHSLVEHNEAMFKLYLQIAMFNGGKIQDLICGKELAKMLVNLPGDQKQLKDEEFYKMGYHGIIPIYVDTSMGAGDVLVVCKKGVEKIRVLELHEQPKTTERPG